MAVAELIVCNTRTQCLGDVSALPRVPGFWYGISTVDEHKYTYIDMGVYLSNGVRHPIPWPIEKKMWTKFFSYSLKEKRAKVFFFGVKGLVLRLLKGSN